MRLFHPALALLVAAAMTSSALAAGHSSKMKSSMAETTTLKVSMMAQNGSKESGTATLTQQGKNVQVAISLNNAKGTQPAHIHKGTCAKLNPAPAYPLSNVVNGKSTSTVNNVDLDKLAAGGFAINVHKSANDLKTYVSCGDLTL
jgi:hypothetical protein